MPDLNEAIKQVHRELDQVRQVKKCKSCECLLDVLEAMQGDLGEIETPQAEAARAEIQRWLNEGNTKRHKCLGCELCLPIKPYNEFSALLRGGGSISAKAPPVEKPPAPPCDCGDT